MTFDELKEKSIQFQRVIELPTGSEPAEIMSRLEVLMLLIAQTGKYLADAKYFQEQAINNAIVGVITEENYSLSASTLNQYVKAKARDYNYLVNMLDRINASAVHQIDALRSILSYRKTEMQL